MLFMPLQRSPFLFRYRLVIVHSLFLFCLAYPVAASASYQWELKEERDGVRFYLRDYPGSAIPEFRAVTRIETSMGSLLAVLLDVDDYTEWIYQCRESFSLDVVSHSEQYVYQVNHLPLARDRDLIMRAQLSYRDGGREVSIGLRAAPDFCRDHDTPGCQRVNTGRYLRIRDSVGSYRMKELDDGTVEVTWQQHLDPGGRLPGWLIRALMSEIPVKTLRALRERVKMPRYSDSEIVIRDGVLRVVHRTHTVEAAQATRP